MKMGKKLLYALSKQSTSNFFDTFGKKLFQGLLLLKNNYTNNKMC